MTRKRTLFLVTLSSLAVMGGGILSLDAQDLGSLPFVSPRGEAGSDQLRALSLRAAQRNAVGREPNYADPNFTAQIDAGTADSDAVVDAQGRSPIEALLSGEAPNEVSLDLKQFGYAMFARKATSFAPVTNVPVGPDYRLGPGDRFSVTLWGRQNDQLSITVGRDGQVILPEVGVLSVGGMTFERFQAYLESELRRKYTDFRMHVSMERLRTITVYVVGEAQAPGSYTLSALSTVLHALFASGGPTKNGSLRRIQIVRGGQPVETVDIYDLLMRGDPSGDIRLMDGDLIHIPLIGGVVALAGNVRRPAIYELASERTLGEALELAGGATHAGWLQHVQIDRVEEHTRRSVVDLDLSEVARDGAGLDTPVQDGDVIKVFPVLEREEGIVFLTGHVVRDTTFELRAGLRLADVLRDRRLFRPAVNLEYGQIERQVPPDLHRIVIPFNLGRLLAGDSAENKVLQDLDTIRLYRWDERGKRSVTISGAVYEPNEYPLVPGMRLRDLIDAAGGLRKDAYLLKAEISRYQVSQRGSQAEQVNVSLERALQYDVSQNILLQDYDRVVVRPIPELDMNDVVVLSGEVLFPGAYPIHRGERLSEVIERAGGFTSTAFLPGAVFTRASARAVQQQRVRSMIAELEQSVLGEMSEGLSGSADAESAEMQQAALDAKQQLVARLRQVEATGRVVIRLAPLDTFRGGAYDLVLEDGDELAVPRRPGVVNVVGEVFNATALLYESGRTVQYYLNRVGGTTKDADRKQISVIRADGSVISAAQKGVRRIAWDTRGNRWTGGGFLSRPLEPGDTIVVPRKLDRIFWLKNTKDVTQILFQMALAAGVVIAL